MSLKIIHSYLSQYTVLGYKVYFGGLGNRRYVYLDEDLNVLETNCEGEERREAVGMAREAIEFYEDLGQP